MILFRIYANFFTLTNLILMIIPCLHMQTLLQDPPSSKSNQILSFSWQIDSIAEGSSGPISQIEIASKKEEIRSLECAMVKIC